MLSLCGLSRLQEHWDTWVTFADLEELRQAGINALRIPVAYWTILPQRHEPFVGGGLRYLVRVCDWAAQLGLRVLLELHAAPGRQNNMDHSGWQGHMGWQVAPCKGEMSSAMDQVGRIACTTVPFTC